jgi:hypothetical protein
MTHINNLLIINSYYSCSNLRCCSLVLSAPHSSRAVQIEKKESSVATSFVATLLLLPFKLILFLLKPAMLLTGVVRAALFSRGADREEGSSVATSFVATLLQRERRRNKAAPLQRPRVKLKQHTGVREMEQAPSALPRDRARHRCERGLFEEPLKRRQNSHTRKRNVSEVP